MFRAISLATGKHVVDNFLLTVVKLSSLGGGEAEKEEEERTLPEMLVRIPVNTDPTTEDNDKS